jgi:hypothetical protein
MISPFERNINQSATLYTLTLALTLDSGYKNGPYNENQPTFNIDVNVSLRSKKLPVARSFLYPFLNEIDIGLKL